MRKILISGLAALICAAARTRLLVGGRQIGLGGAQSDQPTQRQRARDGDSNRRICVADRLSDSRIRRRICRTQAEWDAPGRKIAVERGNNIVPLGAEETEQWRTAAQPVIDNWVAEMTAKGIDGQALLDEARALIDKYTKAQ